MGKIIRKGRIFVLSAPSGSGKTTLRRRLLKQCRSLVASVSVTTRKRRKAEEPGRDYIFVSKEEFVRYKNTGRLLEWASVFGNYYGTPKDFVENSRKKGKDVLLTIDVKGAFKVKRKAPDAVMIFVLPPSMKELKKRLKRRKTEAVKQLRLRLKIAERELAQAGRYDYRVVNDNIDRAVRCLKKIMAGSVGSGRWDVGRKRRIKQVP